MKISVIIPFYAIDQEKYEILQRCVKSLPEHYETIVVHHETGGMAWAINQGVKCATGTHLLIMNDDVEYVSGDLERLCLEDVSTSPSFMGKTYEFLWGSCFCIPKKVWDKIGAMDERYGMGYFDDNDLIETLIKNGFGFRAISEVIFDHEHPGRTLDNLPDRNVFFEANRIKFMEKWGHEPR